MTRILLVEDEPTIAAGVRDDLQFEGYAVDVATDGATALSQGRQGQYDLILLDVMLPETDGFTVCRELRGAGIRTPVIMLTARGQEADKVLGLELGADDYITKPFSRRELQSRVKAALRRGAMAGNAPAELYAFGSFKVDFQRCELWKDDRQVDITALELKLLRTLIANRGQVLTLDRIAHDVWGKEAFITNRVVYTHMNNLRKKVETDPQNPRHVITVRGIGYRFDS
jgi:two-component system alkaline phosphatase synthesis response regulator PhoP